MDPKTISDLEAAFSLLPSDKAQEAKEQLLKAFTSGTLKDSLQLKWSEHDIRGTFQRGGVTDMIERSTRLLSNSQEDPDIHELADRARSESLSPGKLELLPEGDRFAWYLPFSPSKADVDSSHRLRGLMVTEPIFREVLGLMNPGSDLTGAERRVLFQIAAGLTPREAAATDGVSFETKRAQIKTASAKIHCAGQKDLVRKVLGQLVHLLSVSDGEAVHAEPAEAFASRHLADDVELTVQRLPGGRLLRLFECGPRNGRPVVMIHGMMFPISLVGISRHLETAGIRLIIPIRPGFLESRSVSELAGSSGLIGDAMSDLALYLREWPGPAVIMGQSLGAVVAIRFANRHPSLVSQLVLQSLHLSQGDKEGRDHAGEFYGGLKRLSRNPELFKLVNWQFKKYYADRRTGRIILSRLFADSAVDMQVLDGSVTGFEAYGMFAELYASSVFGMSADFNFVMNAWEQEARKIDKSITFIHGSDDPLTKVAQFEQLAERRLRNRLIVVSGGGHFIAASHGREVWRAVADCLE